MPTTGTPELMTLPEDFVSSLRDLIREEIRLALAERDDPEWHHSTETASRLEDDCVVRLRHLLDR